MHLIRGIHLATAALLAAAPAAVAASGTIEVVSVNSAGKLATGGTSFFPSISGDGNLVAFESSARNLAAKSSNTNDIYVRDRSAGTTTLVSVGTDGAIGNGPSGIPVISRDGRRVAFNSYASDLVAGDTNGKPDVFVRDLAGGTTIRASVGPHGKQALGASFTYPLGFSATGRYLAFSSDATNLTAGAPMQVFVRDLKNGTTRLESVGTDGKPGNGAGGDSGWLSGNGRFLVFDSSATNLVSVNTGGLPNIFLRDRKTRTTVLVSVAADKGPADGLSVNPYVSDDGTIVAFDSFASNLVPGDTNKRRDVFVRDLTAGTTTRISVPAGGGQANRPSAMLGMTPDGRYVLFESDATNLVASDSTKQGDVFVYDRVAKTTTLVSVAQSGAQGDRNSGAGGAISTDGQTVAFGSYATNLVPNDRNGRADVFVRVLGGS